jgi:hypothetical protein
MNKFGKFLCMAALALPLATQAHAQYAQPAPPPPVVERPGPVPYGGAVWVPGHHRWNGYRYVWVPGHYVHARRPGAVWVPWHWVQTPHGWVYRQGHWRY